MTQLPICYHRGTGEISPGRFPCNHPGLAATKGVTEKQCLDCEAGGKYCNREPVPPTVPPIHRMTAEELPCAYRGKVLRQVSCGCGNRGEMVDVYACQVEGEATLQATGKCNKKEIVAPGTGTKLPACVGCEKNPNQESIVPDNGKVVASNVQEIQQKIADRRAQMQQRRASSPVRVARQEGNTIHLEFDKKIVGPIRMALAYLETMEQDDPKRWNDFIIDGLKQADEMLKQGMTIVKESPKKEEVSTVANASPAASTPQPAPEAPVQVSPAPVSHSSLPSG